MNRAWALFLALLLTPPVVGQDIGKSYLHRLPPGSKRYMTFRFALFNACRPMDLSISLSNEARAIGLTESDLRAAAESRLRPARLYAKDKAKTDSALLFVLLHVSGTAVYAEVAYYKRFTDEFGYSSLAALWNESFAHGPHGGDADAIMAELSRKLDLFVVDYLRVNEEACE